MIVVDSSVWIDYFNGKDTANTNYLDSILGCEPIATGDLILVEVLRGFRLDRDCDTARKLLAELTLYEMVGEKRAVAAAVKYRILRRQGITIRKAIDVLIGSFCIDENLPLLYEDRDFMPMVGTFGLIRAFPQP